MTKEEYLKLVQSSEAFKGLDSALQKKILDADGRDRESYLQIFLSEKNSIIAARRELIKTTGEVVKTLEKDAKKAKRDFLKDAEEGEKDASEDNAEALLNSLQ